MFGTVRFSRVGSAMVTCSLWTGKSRTTLCTSDSGLEQERFNVINVAFRWIRFLRTGVPSCLPTCAQGSSAAVSEFGERRFWEILGAPVGPVHGEVLALLVCPFNVGYAGVPIAGHALWAEIGGSIIFVAYWEFTGRLQSTPISGFHSNALGKFGEVVVTTLV